MSYYPFDVGSILFALGQFVVIAAFILLLVLVVRLILSATRALNAITTERTLRIEQLRGQLDDGDSTT